MKNILLFPGGFKPFHDGHLSILKSHIFNIDNVHIDKVYIYISPKDRESITADSTLWFLNKINRNLNNYFHIDIIPKISDIPSPIAKCYNQVNNDLSDNKYCLVTSDKDNDLKRKIDFVNYYLKGGKGYNEYIGEQTIYIDADIEPILYKLRYDEFNNKPVSSSIIRKDIINDDFYLFGTAYKFMLDEKLINKYILEEYFEKLSDLK